MPIPLVTKRLFRHAVLFSLPCFLSCRYRQDINRIMRDGHCIPTLHLSAKCIELSILTLPEYFEVFRACICSYLSHYFPRRCCTKLAKTSDFEHCFTALSSLFSFIELATLLKSRFRDRKTAKGAVLFPFSTQKSDCEQLRK